MYGRLQGGDPKPAPESSPSTVSGTNGLSGKPKSLPIKIIQALLPLLLVVVAFAIKTYVDRPQGKR